MGVTITNLEGLRKYSQKAFPKLAEKDTQKTSSVPSAFSLTTNPLELNT